MFRSRRPHAGLSDTALCCAIALAATVTGCGATCDRNPDTAPHVYEDGITDLEDGIYETSPFSGPYLDFPAGRTYRLMHGLGAPPRVIDPWLSFDEHPIPAAGGARRDGHSNTTPGAGNQTVIEAVTAEYIDIRNDTCSDIFLRVVASSPER